MSAIEFKYNAPPTVARFLKSDASHKLISGPVGSGKSVGCCVDILKRCVEMPPWDKGVRRSKFAIVRNTMRELRSTTLETWMTWMKDLGVWKEQKFQFEMKFADVEATIIFMPLDGPGDIGRLLSLELTGIWLNECREIPIDLIPDIKGRLGRFPSYKSAPSDDAIKKWYPARDGQKTWYWSGIICDTNPPEEDSKWMRAMEGLPVDKDDPTSIMPIEVFKQPSGLSPEAENIENLKPGYYEDLAANNPKHWVDVYVHGKYGKNQAGMPVYDNVFHMDRHVVDNLAVDPTLPVVVGFDTGLTPAFVFMQMGLDGRVRVLKEAALFDMGMKRACELHIKPIIKNFFPTNPLIFVGDPAGNRRADSDESTAFQVIKRMFADEGAVVKAASTNDPVVRIQATEQMLCQYPNGEPLMQIARECSWYIEGLRSKYRYAKMRGADKYHDKPEKNEWSHIVEAGQYAHLFLGNGKYHPMDYTKRNSVDDPFGFHTRQPYRPAQSHGY